MPDVGDPAPDFALPSDDGPVVSLKDLRGKTVVLYFYPKDDTPGCTKEACSFRDNLGRVTTKGAAVFGVSRDGLYGRESWGIERTTFLIDAKGRIARVWPKVKVEGHVDEVLAAL